MSEHYERVTGMMPGREPHEARYHLAAGFLQAGDRVIDAACGTGYGAAILGNRIDYVGVERDLGVLEVKPRLRRRFVAADLETWGGPAEPFDVAVVLETVEHLRNPMTLRDWTYRARRLVVVSVPIVPSDNPYHHHDYRPGEILTLWRNMKVIATFEQPREGTGLWVFAQW